MSGPGAAPVTVTEQAPPESWQVDSAPNETPPVPVCENVTCPVGELPTTVAVHWVGDPVATEEAVQLTEVVDGVWVMTWKVAAAGPVSCAPTT